MARLVKEEVLNEREEALIPLFSTLREPSANRKDMPDLALVGPTGDNQELDPLAVYLNNPLCIMYDEINVKHKIQLIPKIFYISLFYPLQGKLLIGVYKSAP